MKTARYTEQCNETNIGYQVNDYRRWISEGSDLSEIVADIKSGKNPMKFYGGNQVSPLYARCILEAAGYKFPSDSVSSRPAEGGVSIGEGQYSTYQGKLKNKLIEEYETYKNPDKTLLGQEIVADGYLRNDNIRWLTTLKCLKVGEIDGYQSLINECDFTVQWGYCVVDQPKHPLRCAARESPYSRTGKTYIQGTGGLDAGQTYKLQDLSTGDKVAFVVGCVRASYPLIEAVSSEPITSKTRVQASCWQWNRAP